MFKSKTLDFTIEMTKHTHKMKNKTSYFFSE